MIQKHIIVMSSIALVLSVASSAYAQTKTATKSASISPSKATTLTPTGTASDEVDKLKEKVAEKVSKLANGEDKSTAGIVQEISDKEFTLKSMDGDTSKVTLDDTLTKYYTIGGSTKEVKKADIKKGDYVFAIGPEIGGQINANGVYVDQRYIVTSGKITEVNADDYSIKIVTLDKNNYILDIQTRTTQEMLNIKTLTLEQVGFSTLKEGDSIHVVLKANLQNDKQTRFDAEKILIIPNEYFLQ